MTVTVAKTILFLCTANSCRSQMAEGFARKYAPAGTTVLSAGTQASHVNATAIEVMKEVGVDISAQTSNSINEMSMDKIDIMVAVCSHANQRCPILPGNVERLFWDIADPMSLAGSQGQLIDAFRKIRDDIERRVQALFKQ